MCGKMVKNKSILINYSKYDLLDQNLRANIYDRSENTPNEMVYYTGLATHYMIYCDIIIRSICNRLIPS